MVLLELQYTYKSVRDQKILEKFDNIICTIIYYCICIRHCNKLLHGIITLISENLTKVVNVIKAFYRW